MLASHLKTLLAVGMMAPAISLAGNPFVPAPAPSESLSQLEMRVQALEERVAKVDPLIQGLTMENLPGVPGGMLRNAEAVPVLEPDAEVLGIVNGKCLIKRSGLGGSSLEGIDLKGPCEPRQAPPAPL